MSDAQGASLPAEGRVMGLDYGTTRIGIALSDGLRLGANAYRVIEAGDPDLDRQLAGIVDEYGVTVVVVGLPTSLDGSERRSANGARAMAERLRESLQLPVVLYDERFTTKMAEQTLLAADTSRRKRKLTIDKLAAALMLQGFLDHLRSDGDE